MLTWHNGDGRRSNFFPAVWTSHTAYSFIVERGSSRYIQLWSEIISIYSYDPTHYGSIVARLFITKRYGVVIWHYMCVVTWHACGHMDKPHILIALQYWEMNQVLSTLVSSVDSALCIESTVLVWIINTHHTACRTLCFQIMFLTSHKRFSARSRSSIHCKAHHARVIARARVLYIGMARLK